MTHKTPRGIIVELSLAPTGCHVLNSSNTYHNDSIYYDYQEIVQELQENIYRKINFPEARFLCPKHGFLPFLA